MKTYIVSWQRPGPTSIEGTVRVELTIRAENLHASEGIAALRQFLPVEPSGIYSNVLIVEAEETGT